MARRKLERDRLGALALGGADCSTFGAAGDGVDTGRVITQRVVALDVGVLRGGDGQRADGERVFTARDAWTRR